MNNTIHAHIRRIQVQAVGVAGGVFAEPAVVDGVEVAVVGVVFAGALVAVHAAPAEGDVCRAAEVECGDVGAVIFGSVGLVGFAEAGGVVVEFFDDLAGCVVDNAHERAAVVGEGDIGMLGDRGAFTYS